MEFSGKLIPKLEQPQTKAGTELFTYNNETCPNYQPVWKTTCQMEEIIWWLALGKQTHGLCAVQKTQCRTTTKDCSKTIRNFTLSFTFLNSFPTETSLWYTHTHKMIFSQTLLVFNATKAAFDIVSSLHFFPFLYFMKQMSLTST